MSADLTKQVSLIFKGIDETGAATSAALNNAAKFSQSVGNISAPLADFTRSAVTFQSALLAGGAAVTAFAVKAAGDFDGAFREIATLIDKPIEDLGEFRGAILDYANTSTQPLETITAAIYNAISSGADYSESIGLISQAERLAVATKSDLNQAVNALLPNMNAYGASMDEAGDYADALFTAVKNGKTTLPELEASLSGVTSIAANAGVDFDELLAALASLTSSGMPTSQAVSALKQTISSIISPTSEAEAAAKKLGIGFNASALESRGLAGVLADVQRATGGNVEEMSSLFGSVEGLSGALTLTGGGAERFSETLREMEEDTGSVTTAFDKMKDGVANSNQLLVNSLQGLLIKIGDPLLEAYGDVAEGIAAVFNAVGVEVERGQLGGLVDYIGSVMNDAVQALAEIVQALPEAFELADMSGFQAGLQRIVESVTNLFSGFDLTSPQGLADALTALGGSFEALSNFTASAVEQFQYIFDYIANNKGDIVEFAKNWADTAGAIGGIATQVDTILPSVDKLISVMTGLAGILAVKQTGSIVAASGKALQSLKAIGAAIGPGGAVALAAIYLGDRLLKLSEAWDGLKDANNRAETASMESERALGRVGVRLESLSESLGIPIRDMDHFRQLVEDGTVVFDQASSRWELAGNQLEKLGSEADQSGQAIRQTGMTGKEAADALRDALAGAEEGFGSISVEAKDGEVVVRKFGEGAAAAFDETAAAADRAIEQSEGYRLRMAAIASDERIQNIRARFEFDIAALEAQTQQIEAAFASINNTVSETGSLIGDLTGSLTDTRFREEFEFVQDLINREEERRDRALELQEELTQAQIEQMRARSDALANGQALINIDGAGLQPHLEAFMWEILRTIQVRVNADGMEMLLGQS